MPVTSVVKDPEAATLTVVADFAAPLERLWNAYVDPRQIERFWGPPYWPATFWRHDVTVGGRSIYTMTGPEGDESTGYWEWIALEPGRSFEVRDGFALDTDGTPNTEMPSLRIAFNFEATEGGSRLTTVSYFDSLESLEQLVQMGMEEGMRAAMGQIDDVLADLAAFAADAAAAAQVLTDTKVRIARVIRGPRDMVWRAHHEPELMKTWLLGPDGWVMTECELSTVVGEKYRYAWEPVPGGPADGASAFGFEGEVLANEPPYRSVTTERMIGMPGEPSVNELTLTPHPAGTLLSLVITYPNKEVRDIVLATGMTSGMETSYQRLEGVLAS